MCIHLIFKAHIYFLWPLIIHMIPPPYTLLSIDIKEHSIVRYIFSKKLSRSCHYELCSACLWRHIDKRRVEIFQIKHQYKDQKTYKLIFIDIGVQIKPSLISIYCSSHVQIAFHLTSKLISFISGRIFLLFSALEKLVEKVFCIFQCNS